MKKNVFLKSVLRQPIRAFILSILIAAAAFAFVARATEFIIVSDELTRIEAFYRSVGILSPTRFDNFTTDHDVTRALDTIESNRHVAISDTRNFTQGVLTDMLNLASQPVHFTIPYFNPVLHGVDIGMSDLFFIATLIDTPRLWPGPGHAEMVFMLNLEELILGDPTIIRIGDRIFTNERGQTINLLGNELMRLYLTEAERSLIEAGLWNPFGDLQAGDTALLRVTPRYDGGGPRAMILWHVRSLVGTDGFRRTWYDSAQFGILYRLMPVERVRSHTDDLVFYVDASDSAAVDSMLYYLQDEMEMIAENLSTVMVTETKDMTAMPRFMDRRISGMLDTALFPAGRWITHEDYLMGNPVVIVSTQLANRRGISIGDTLTITIRDNPRPYWIDTPTDSPWALGIENWWDNNASPWWGMIDAAHEDWRSFPTYELDLEVVGTFWFSPPNVNNFTSSEIIIPAGLIPDSFGWDDAPQLTGMYSFVLGSPRSEERFLQETRAELYAMGFVASFVPTRFDVFAAATDPIRFSITVNLVVFGAASVLILAFIVLLYLRQWRRSVAITQALGTPRRRVLSQLFTPTLILWVPAVILGALVGWFFAIGQADAILAELAVYEGMAKPAIYLLFSLCGLIILCILAGVLLGGYGVVRRPVLVQLQGGTLKRRRADYVDSGVVPEDFALGEVAFVPLPKAMGFIVGVRTMLRHNLRHIFRTPIKTALAFLLALMFVFSLGWLNHTIHTTEEEIARLWDTTIINAEVYRVVEFGHGVRVDVDWPAVIAPATWDVIVYSGFYGDSYLESYFRLDTGVYLGVSHLEGLIAENTRTVVDEQLGVICDDIEIEFLPGFGPEDFIYAYPIPMIIRRTMDDLATHFADTRGQVIGVFDGGLERAVNSFGEYTPIYIIPIQSHRAVFSGRMPFYGGIFSFETYYPTLLTARFTIDPARNRDIDQFRDLVTPALSSNSLRDMLPLQLHVDDDVIHNVIIPMEQNLSLLRVLYPIAIGVAFILALGLSLLTMLQSAKNAAIMRVLGKPRLTSQVMLCTEQLIVCAAGVLIGLLVLLITGSFMGISPLALSGVYISGAIIGSVIGAFVISMRAPLDLLQVRE